MLVAKIVVVIVIVTSILKIYILHFQMQSHIIPVCMYASECSSREINQNQLTKPVCTENKL